MKKLISLLLVLMLCLPVMAMAETAADALLYTIDFGDFTMDLYGNDYYEMAAEKASNTVYAIVYPAYDETSATHNNFNIVWSEMDATAEITLYGAANYASLVQMAAQQQYKSMGINMTDLQVLSATFEDGVGAFITTANLDYTGMGYDVITPQYQLQTYYCMGDAGTYIFTFTATTMEELEALSSYLDSVVFK